METREASALPRMPGWLKLRSTPKMVPMQSKSSAVLRLALSSTRKLMVSRQRRTLSMSWPASCRRPRRGPKEPTFIFLSEVRDLRERGLLPDAQQPCVASARICFASAMRRVETNPALPPLESDESSLEASGSAK